MITINAKTLLALAAFFFVFGIVVIFGAYPDWVTTAGKISIMAGAGIATAINILRKGWRRYPVLPWEFILYVVTTVLFIALLAFASAGYFSDFLTFPFAIAFVASVITVMVRRIV